MTFRLWLFLAILAVLAALFVATVAGVFLGHWSHATAYAITFFALGWIVRQVRWN